LYKKLLYKSEFGQAHCIEWFKNIHTKFNLPFLDIPTSFYEFLEVCPIFWELNQLKNDLKSPHNAGPKSACGTSWSPRGQWWLAGGKVLPVSSRGPPRGRWATRAEAGLTEVMAQ
jgi:hypothetical protein